MGELILALRENDSHMFKVWLSVGMRELGQPAVAELMCDDINPNLTSEEADRMVGMVAGTPVIKPRISFFLKPRHHLARINHFSCRCSSLCACHHCIEAVFPILGTIISLI